MAANGETYGYETAGVKYIGSKNKLIRYIHECIPVSFSSRDETNPPSIIDVFTGTTRVAQSFRQRGWRVITSDLNWASTAYSALFIQTTTGDIPRLSEFIAELNELPGIPDWISRNYCDVASAEEGGENIRMWSPENGAKADNIRNRIESWFRTGRINEIEYYSLIGILIFALDAVDNSVGVQQAYLKKWSERSKNPLILNIPPELIRLVDNPVGIHFEGDALRVEYPEADIAYLDPPYTIHSYSTYYHIWDSIIKWDKPEVGLKTNRRIDRVSGSDVFDETMKSPWNYKKSAKVAFESLIDRLNVKYVMISYSNESIIPIGELIDITKKYTSYTIREIDHNRNIMSLIGNGENPNNHTNVVEYLITIEK
jgi:adenine-specific DNA-methyltransferase